jgi:hypothetical protein
VPASADVLGPAALYTLCLSRYTWQLSPLDVALLAFSCIPQMRLLAPAHVSGTWSATHQAYVIPSARLPFYADSDWSLDFGLPASPSVLHGAANASASTHPPGPGKLGVQPTAGSDDGLAHVPAHVLHMVLHVPPAEQQPLRLLLANGSASATNSYVVPTWGAVTVWAGQLGGQDTSDAPSSPGTHQQGPARQMRPSEVHEYAQAALAQLRQLLGLPETPGGAPLQQLTPPQEASGGQQPPVTVAVGALAPGRGLCTWEVDALQRARAGHDMSEAARLLGSFSRLAQVGVGEGGGCWGA